MKQPSRNNLWVKVRAWCTIIVPLVLGGVLLRAGSLMDKNDLDRAKLIVEVMTPIFLAIVAVWGFRRWQVELRGKSKFELACEIARLSCEFEKRFTYARSSITFSNEADGRPQGENESSQDKARRDESFARDQRLEGLRNILLDLSQKVWEADFVLNDDLSELIKPYEQAYSDLRTAIIVLFSDVMHRHGEHLAPDSQQEYHSVLYSMGKDELSDLVEHTGKILRNRLKAHIE